MNNHVFISYAYADNVIANKVCKVLEDAGIKCWIGPRDIASGEQWAAAIVKAIRQSIGMVLIFSEETNRSIQIRREIELVGKHYAKPIIPFRIQSVAPDDTLDYFIHGFQWIDAFPGPVEVHLAKLVFAVGELWSSHEKETTKAKTTSLSLPVASSAETKHKLLPNDQSRIIPKPPSPSVEQQPHTDRQTPEYWLHRVAVDRKLTPGDQPLSGNKFCQCGPKMGRRLAGIPRS
jgi:hypothetical protein